MVLGVGIEDFSTLITTLVASSTHYIAISSIVLTFGDSAIVARLHDEHTISMMYTTQ